jgi:hypothetical protein
MGNMVMSSPDFTIEYDDFSGGYFAGPRGTAQPRNTWRGVNITSPVSDGTLMPTTTFASHGATATGTTGGGSSGGVGMPGIDSSRFIYLNAGSWAKWAGATTTTGLGVGSPVGEIRPVAFDGSFFVPGSSGSQISRWTGTGAASAIAVQAPFGMLEAWGEFLVAAGSYGSSEPQRLYYSAASDGTSWPSGNYVDIGVIGGGIRCLVAVGGELLVGKDDGWYAVNGVLGETETVRKVAPGGPVAGSFDQAPAVATPWGSVVFRSRASGITEMRGSLQQPFIYPPAGANGAMPDVDALGLVGSKVVMTIDGKVWVREANGGFTVYDSGSSIVNFVAFTEPAANTLIARESAAWKSLTLDQSNPGHSGSAYYSATAQLAEYQHRTPFEVLAAIAEVECGSASVSTNGDATLGLRILAPAHPDVATAAAVGSVASTLQTASVSSTLTPAAERKTARFAPSDAPASMSIVPEVTLKGVKLRRLLLRCRELSEW